MSKIRPKRSIAPPPSNFYENLHFQNDGYIKVMEILSHVVIERNHISNAITIEKKKEQKFNPFLNESVYNLKRRKNKTNFIPKHVPKKEPRVRKRDKFCEWFKLFLPKEEIEILSHEKQQSGIGGDILPLDVFVGRSKELSKPGS